MSELTIVTFKWRGWRGDTYYKPEHVNALGHMLKDHCSLPYRFVCVTDDTHGVEFETYPLWNGPAVEVPKNKPNCFKRLRLFDRLMAKEFGPKILQLDLDCVLMDDIAPLITDDPFKIMYGKAAKYNGSMWQVKPREMSYVWDDFGLQPREAQRELYVYNHKIKRGNYGSDQAWLSYKIQDAPMWTNDDGCYHYTLLHPDVRSPGNSVPRSSTKLPKNARAVFFAGGTKPWSPGVAEKNPALYEAYRRYMNVNFHTG